MMAVLVTGATGFIAQHVIKELLKQGYDVIGTVRSEAKGKYLSGLFDSTRFTYAVVSDVVAKGAFDEVLESQKDIETFIHTASPVDFQVKDVQKALLTPAIEGTKNVLNAIEKYGNVKTVIVTSSTAAVRDSSGNRDPDERITESTWNKITLEQGLASGRLGYDAAKTFAEKEVWRFAEKHEQNFNVITVNPTFVFGPQAFEIKDLNNLNESAEMVNRVLKLKSTDTIPHHVSRFIDVRDVAKAHVEAVKRPNELKGTRLMLLSYGCTNELIAYIINQHFPSVDIPKGSMQTHEQQLKVGDMKWDNSKTKSLLKHEFISLEDSIVDTVQQILDAK
ncbi:hypothetical protein KGF57_002565 [Candida theae]|uniref:NAD-dependent epimerase/dehydratase domain-containing protein n=1 Tax=Candida theae TaxID=1198502 RepID=A0AAD5BF00_9ASCO|nr:uncharacterized protein KGF57_002565 [Candida theae]KAI5958210.1 hypothetical protein KGF57_002565 [Candida theae]